MYFTLYYRKWVKKYGFIWCTKNFSFITWSFKILKEINKHWGNDVNFNTWLMKSDLNTNYKYVYKVCKTREGRRGMDFSSSLRQITRIN